MLEFVLTGAIPHERPDSAELARRAGKEVNDQIARHRPKAVIINLLGFDYSFGNEIGSVLLGPCMTLAHSGGGKMAILATGQTAATLDNLLKTCRLDAVFGTTHPDLASGLAKMNDVPAAAKGSAESQTTRRLDDGKAAPDIPLEEKCPSCGRNLVIRNEPDGDFVCCGRYPRCTWSLPTSKNFITVKCLEGKEGEIIWKKSRGSYRCSGYPKRRFTSARRAPASVGALFGGGRRGFTDYPFLLLFFVAVVIAAVVIPRVAAKRAPPAILLLIPGGPLLVIALAVLNTALQNRRRQGAAAKADMPVAKGSSIAKEFLREKNGVAILQVSDRPFEFDEAHLLESHFAALLQDGRKQIIIDLSQVRFIGATGVGALTKAFLEARRAGAQIKFVASPKIQEVFESTGLATAFDIYSDEDSAVSAYIARRAGSSNRT